jgi:hypothetical protein
MLDTIAAALSVCRALMPDAESLPAQLDIAAANDTEAFPFATGARIVTETLMAEVIGGTPKASTDSIAAAALGSLRRGIDAAGIRLNQKRRDQALGDAAAMIREIGLERYTLDCSLATDRRGGKVLACASVSPITAHAILLERLLQRAEMFTFSDQFLVLERQASAWDFGRWSTARLANENAELTRTLREQEWSLVSRDSLALEESIMTAFMADEAFGDVPPRQQRLAHGLQRSVVGVFDITAVDGTILTARSVRDDAVYHVHEHNDEVLRLAKGIIIGRLIPLEEHLWMRSPGAVALAGIDEHRLSLLAEGFTKLGRTMPAPLIVEATITRLVFGEMPPRQLPPALSARHARVLLDTLYPALDAMGLGREVAATEVPAEVLAQTRGRDVRMMGYSLDQTMAEWMEALSAQAEVSSPARSGASRWAKKGNGKKSRGKKGKRRR